MHEIEPLGLNAQAWQFLSSPKRYVNASVNGSRPLVLESTARQFKTARDILVRLNGSHNVPARKGVLLADDVGLGKTTVAALVAWVVARASGATANVRILAPNEPMRRRWVEELASHVPMLLSCAPHLKAAATHLRGSDIDKLRGGRIQVATHYHASEGTIACDLLIIDEAHRAKGEGSQFARALKAKSKLAKRILIVTATPFSIDISELERMLMLAGADSATTQPVRSYARALARLFEQDAGHDIETAAQDLATRAESAVSAMRPYVIRHGIDDLPDERSTFGRSREWPMTVPHASLEELELVIRTDRMLKTFSNAGRITNDSRFHTGRSHLATRIDEVEQALRDDPQHSKRHVLEHQLDQIRTVRGQLGAHPKVEQVARAVAAKVEIGEKVVVFCHHHATAQEFILELARRIQKRKAPSELTAQTWLSAWDDCLWTPPKDVERTSDFDRLRQTFIDWLTSSQIRSQVASWLRQGADRNQAALSRALESSPVRHCTKAPSVAEAANELLKSLTSPDAPSTLGVIRSAAKTPALLPGYSDPLVATCSCLVHDSASDRHLFLGAQQPDTLLHVFNSPFGPDVLVTTDALSEGVDLHRYCRHLVHFELDPSPIRTVQRNGRLRRVRSWAAVTGEPINYGFPAFGGTRDHRLVQIMKKRVDTFSLLLGGVQSIDFDADETATESWRQDVIDRARKQLSKTNGRLAARGPDNFE